MASTEITKASSTLPFGKQVPLSAISGSTYVTAQLLVQQIAYKLSDKIFSYSPLTFDLDVAAKQWASEENRNIHGYAPGVLPLQTRTGAGALALGYIFSPDFDVSRRHIPQTLLAPSGSLNHLRGSLDQLSLLYNLSSPFVAHVAAADYAPDSGLVSDYDTAMRLAEELGFALVSTSSAYEAQHMSLFATLLATLLPTIHLYDGIRLPRETLRVGDALSEDGVANLYNKLTAGAANLNQRLDTAGKALELLRLFNDELGTVYEPFEYHGHATPDVVLVAFGSVETQVAKQVLASLASQDAKAGVVNVRLYRPFIEEAFLKAIPESTRTIAVLGQVKEDADVADEAAQSALFTDVLTSVTFSGKFEREPEVLDIKYTAAQPLTPQSIADTLHKVFGNEDEAQKLPPLLKSQQFTFWNLDDAVALDAPAAIGLLLSKESTTNVHLYESHDNLTRGGVIRSDLRASGIALEAPYSVSEADVVAIGNEVILKEFDVLRSVASGGKILLHLPNCNEAEIEKKLPAAFRKAIQERGIELFVLKSQATALVFQLAFLKIALPQFAPQDLGAPVPACALQEAIDAVAQSLKQIEVPASWAEDDAAALSVPALVSVQANSFVPFQKEEQEVVPQLYDWQTAAKGLVFKEAYGTKTALRPDLTVTTATITVRESRRLTPLDYNRNIFHIEFDIGNSGFEYKIGQALGIHAENDDKQVNEFIEFYGLNPAELVEVPSREDPSVIEVRTVFQALMQNVNILGKVPKRFYECLAAYATDETEKKKLEALGGTAGAEELKKRTDVDTVTFVDILQEFTSAHPSFHDLIKMVGPTKRREYSIASAQAVTPTTVALMIAVVDWVDPRGRLRFGQSSLYLSRLQPGDTVTASLKPSVMKLPAEITSPIIMAGLGTGLAPFRAFVQYRAMQKAQGEEIGPIRLYLGSRHQREEYLYGEEWEAYLDAGVVTFLGAAFSRDQPEKIYIQDRIRQTMDDVAQAYLHEGGSFYLCGPTWPVPDVTGVLMETIAYDGDKTGKKVDPAKEIEKLKEDGRYVLEVY